MTTEGTWATWVFQVDGIHKPLVSVSKQINDAWRAISDEERSYLPHKATGHSIDIKSERGIFTIEAIAEPNKNTQPGFPRPE